MATSSLNIANAPCSWGALEFDIAGESAGYAQVLDEIRDSGYVGTELGDWGFMPTEPDHLQRELAARSLAMVGAFVPIAFAHREAWAAGRSEALRTARLVQAVGGAGAYLILADENGADRDRTQSAGRVRSAQSLSHDQWGVFAEGVQQVAQAVHDETGLRVVFHHHCAGYVETPREVAQLLDRTDPNLVGLCLDTGHYQFAGGDPVEAMGTWAERIWHLHFKDCQPEIAQRSRGEQWDYFESVRQGVFCELGQGAVDFRGVARLAKQAGSCDWITVEQDVLPGMGSPVACARRNREFLRDVLGL